MWEGSRWRERLVGDRRLRTLWLRERGRITKFFHKTVNSHPHTNHIRNIVVNVLLQKEQAVKGGIVHSQRRQLGGLWREFFSDESAWRLFSQRSRWSWRYIICVGRRRPVQMVS